MIMMTTLERAASAPSTAADCLAVRARFVHEPCLWCWVIVNDASGRDVEDSWSGEWCGYLTREEALAAGRRRLASRAAPGDHR